MNATLKKLDSLIRSAEKDDVLLYITAFLGVVTPGLVYISYRFVHQFYANCAKKREAEKLVERRIQSEVSIFHASEDNYTEELANTVAERVGYDSAPVIDLAAISPSVFSNFMGIGVFLIQSTKQGHEPECAEWFFDWLEDMSSRKKKLKELPCQRMHYAILGIGDSKYSKTRFNRAAIILSRRLNAIGASQICKLTLADKNAKKSIEEQIDNWADLILESIDIFIDKQERSSSSADSNGSSSSTNSLELLYSVFEEGCSHSNRIEKYINRDNQLETFEEYENSGSGESDASFD